MRAVTTATAAFALGVDRKTLDNLIRRVDPEALPPGKQGLERRVPVGLLAELSLALELGAQLGVPATRAHPVARELLAGSVRLGRYLVLDADVGRAQAELEEGLAQAIESVVRPRRGRPRRSRGR